ncbi:MAG: glycosyltransferase [Oscillospiraceae bacterium]
MDDNTDESSREMLSSFESNISTVTVLPGKAGGDYQINNELGCWDDSRMLRIANYKNAILKHAVENEYDYLFLVDSDLILHPAVMEHLKKQKKEIVSEIFWTQKSEDLPLEANVCMLEEFELEQKQQGSILSSDERVKRREAFLTQLKVNGLYEVGTLGSCIMIKRSALLKGLSFTPIKNLAIRDEDRIFSIRASVLGIELFVDTRYPAYHILNEQDLEGVPDYVRSCREKHSFIRQYKVKENKITLSMVVRNEEGRYLRRVLESVVGHIDEAVIVDDASTDRTVEICQEILKDIPLRLVRNKTPMFEDSVKLRKKQWTETVRTNPDWILNLDPDEIVEAKFWDSADEMINSSDFDIYLFRLYDMWSETHYREDKFWNSQSTFKPFLQRFQPDFEYDWVDLPQNCGRFPTNTESLPQREVEFRVQNFGWSKPEDRAVKFEKYNNINLNDVNIAAGRYESIMDANPNLLLWQ